MTHIERIGLALSAALVTLRDVLPDLALLLGVVSSLVIIVTTILNALANRRRLVLEEQRAEREVEAYRAGLKVRGEDRRKGP